MSGGASVSCLAWSSRVPFGIGINTERRWFPAASQMKEGDRLRFMTDGRECIDECEPR